MNIKLSIKNLYWLLVLAIFLLQIIFTSQTFNQIRYEELAESVRNVFWLQNKTIYDGISSNVGWYGTLLVIYNFLGFSLNSAKYFRLVLQLISLFCLAGFLSRYLGHRKALIPLISIGLSPTFLYFNTLQTSYGLDLQYLPICLYLISSLSFKKVWFTYIKQVILGIIIMIAWMSYPTFAFYFPALSIFYLWQLKNFPTNFFNLFKNILITSLSFTLPLFIVFIYVKDRSLLWYDQTEKSGIFRGAGNLTLDLLNFSKNLKGVILDLFIGSQSYYYEIKSVDFSLILPALSIFLVLLFSIFLLFKNRKLKFPLILIWLTLIFSLIFANLTFDPSLRPGIRRNTPLLASLYGLLTVFWYFVVSSKWESPSLRNLLIIICLIIPLHHFLIFPFNLSELTKPSLYQYSHIFGLMDSPSKTLEALVKKSTQEELKLSCQDEKGNLAYCRYVEGYAAISGSCFWSHFKCKNILGYDPKTKDFIPLTIDLWENYYWAH
ncbi:MAG: hypothetical protein V1808_00545 [Candidatus Daviesbacteria bacterium]